MKGQLEDMAYTYAVICDIDNCFTDSREWNEYTPENQTDRAGWDKFLDMHYLCKPNKPVIDLVCATAELLPVIFITSREDRKDCRHNTIVQIKEYSKGLINMQDPTCHHKLLMRSEFDYRPSDVVKQEKLIEIVNSDYRPIVAIDDDVNNCKMFLSYRIPTILYNIETNTFKKCKFVGDLDDVHA